MPDSRIDILIVALSIAFFVADYWKPTKVKPFSCVACLTGWLSCWMTAGLGKNWGEIVAMLFIGYFVGSMYGAIKMRWL